jgi:hypothetical protein
MRQPHPARARAIIKAHPEVRQLMVRNPYTAFIALSLVIMQEQCRLASLLATPILFP